MTRSLHVYIEHDGTPWRTLTEPATDPTPRNLFMLELMAGDLAPSLYLGRPCYFGMSDVPPCEPIWWTHFRFSEDVIQSMAEALRGFLVAHPGFATVELYGYSGGGVVAALMAPRVAATRRLVTLASPLDLDGWTRLHQYTPLTGSISPLEQRPLPETVNQLHLAGGLDDVVPDFLIKPFAERQYAAKFVEFSEFDHRCCWVTIWQHTVLGQ